jgi:hypothetical protein
VCHPGFSPSSAATWRVARPAAILQPDALSLAQPALQPDALVQPSVPALQPVATLTPGPTSTREPASDVWAAPLPAIPASLLAPVAPGPLDPWNHAPDPWHSALVAQPDLRQGVPATPPQPQLPMPQSAQSPLLQLQPPLRQPPNAAHHSSTLDLDQRALARQAYQQQLARDQWDQMQYYALLAQRLGQEGDNGYYTIARELRIESAWLRKWHKAWFQVMAGPGDPNA